MNDVDKGDVLENFRPITLLSTKFKILAKILAKVLALVVGSLVGEAYNMHNPEHSNLHHMRYIIDRIGTKSAFGGTLIYLDQ